LTACLTPPPTDTGLEVVSTRLFGAVALRPDDIWNAPFGLPGFTSVRRWAWLPVDGARAAWLQSLEHHDLALLLVPAAVVDPAAWPLEGEPWCVVTLPTGDGAATANLRAPVLLDRGSRALRQFVPERCGFSVRHPVALATLFGADSSSDPSAR
jgi:flagellar assembly factor FliW